MYHILYYEDIHSGHNAPLIFQHLIDDPCCHP